MSACTWLAVIHRVSKKRLLLCFE